MDKRQRLFIYDRREMVVLILLSVMVALFAFTLGVHLGKRVAPPGAGTAKHGTEIVRTDEDALPNRQDMTDQAPAVDAAADEALGRTLHEEVARSGIRLEQPRPTELPKDTVAAPKKGKTAVPSPTPVGEGVAKPKADSHASAKPTSEPATGASDKTETFGESASDKAVVASRRESPPGRYTLQVGSFPSMEEARGSVESLESVGLRPFLRGVEIAGKGRWYRIYVGGYANRDEAQKAGQRYAAEQMIENFLVANMVR